MSGEKITDLVEIRLESGVSMFTGEGFVSVRAIDKAGHVFRGQLSPEQARDHAVAFMEAAEAAISDEAVATATRVMELPDEFLGHLLTKIRLARGDGGQP